MSPSPSASATDERRPAAALFIFSKEQAKQRGTTKPTNYKPGGRTTGQERNWNERGAGGGRERRKREGGRRGCFRCVSAAAFPSLRSHPSNDDVAPLSSVHTIKKKYFMYCDKNCIKTLFINYDFSANVEARGLLEKCKRNRKMYSRY